MTAEAKRITPDEAVAALTAAAWTESISEDDAFRGVEAVRKLCAPTGAGDGRRLYARDVLAVLDGAIGEKRTLIHCLAGGLGADWNLADAVDFARREDAQCAWVRHLLGHELAIWSGGKTRHFQARRPATGDRGAAQ